MFYEASVDARTKKCLTDICGHELLLATVGKCQEENNTKIHRNRKKMTNWKMEASKRGLKGG